jgi:hypothetical protein
MDCPTFLKKSPAGSASTQRPLKRNSAAASKQTQRELMRRLIELPAFTVKTGFSTNVGGLEKKISLPNELQFSLIIAQTPTADTSDCY